MRRSRPLLDKDIVMSKPKHQHFIPKSYLKNFAVAEGNKYFVEAKLSSENSSKENLISIRDICVDKNIYTLPHKKERKSMPLNDIMQKT